MNGFLSKHIEYLKGVGPKRAELLSSELNIHTYEDLLNHIPFRYIDRSKFQHIRDLVSFDYPVQLKGKLIAIKESGVGRKRKLSATFTDQTGDIDLIWFQGIKWILPNLKVNQEYQVYGKAKRFGARWNIAHPEITLVSEMKQQTMFQAVYSTSEKLSNIGLHSKGIEKIICTLISELTQLEETLPNDILTKFDLPNRTLAYQQIHQPRNLESAEKALLRLKYEELFYMQLELLIRKQLNIQNIKGHVFESLENVFNDFYKNGLPFELTNAQKKVLKEIRKDLRSGIHMNRLLQGDVGSGKTLVALLTALMGIGNQFQAAIIAPTEILANQHFDSIQELLSDFDVRVAILTGSTKAKERKILHEQLQSGEINLLIGTHALFEKTVQFHHLGIVIIDEQHRFGVAQRANMLAKNKIPPHVLIMTATPIPRTLAISYYGDLDVSVIDELPPGRKPILTVHKTDKNRLRVFGFMKEEIQKGRQIYIVYPLIRESEKLDFKNLMDGYEAISKSFPLPDYKISIVHGQMRPEDKDYEMQRFVNGETNIMVATTVIEVGVNVPNASVMIIESAERFGLSQLHQLRGRVGRGAEKSYCILMTGDKISADTKKRVNTMVQTNDGFQISEVDLQLRGPGDIMGTQQSGALPLKIANLTSDSQIMVSARETAKNLLEKDPNLQLESNRCVREKLTLILKQKPNWGKIG